MAFSACLGVDEAAAIIGRPSHRKLSILPLYLSLPVLVIVPENTQDQPATSAQGNEQANHGYAGVAENLE